MIEQIYESADSLVYRGIREQDDQAVILKVLKQDYPTPAELTRYKQEYEITRNLAVVLVNYFPLCIHTKAPCSL